MGNDNLSTLSVFVAQTGVTFPVGFELSASYNQLRGSVESISPYPLDVIVDAEGKIAFLKGEYNVSAMRAVLDSLTQ